MSCRQAGSFHRVPFLLPCVYRVGNAIVLRGFMGSGKASKTGPASWHFVDSARRLRHHPDLFLSFFPLVMLRIRLAVSGISVWGALAVKRLLRVGILEKLRTILRGQPQRTLPVGGGDGSCCCCRCRCCSPGFFPHTLPTPRFVGEVRKGTRDRSCGCQLRPLPLAVIRCLAAIRWGGDSGRKGIPWDQEEAVGGSNTPL